MTSPGLVTAGRKQRGSTIRWWPGFWLLVTTLLACAGAGWWWTREVPFERVTGNPICEALVFREPEGSTVIPEDVELTPGSGRYLVVEFLPAPMRPAALEGLALEDPSLWLLDGRIWRRRDWPAPDKAQPLGGAFLKVEYDNYVHRLARNQRHRAVPLLHRVGVCAKKPLSGYLGPLEWDSQRDPQKQGRWTFLSVDHDAQPGDVFVYELALLPCCHKPTNLTITVGAAVPIRRGLITVRETPGSTQSGNSGTQTPD
jgi:hypothetical protein